MLAKETQKMTIVFTVTGVTVDAAGPGYLVQIMRKAGEPAEQKITYVPQGEKPGFSSDWWDFAGFESLEAAQAAYPDAWIVNPENMP
jgi:hypothetical protein